ncbi:MAG: TetR/AcrR family transcriptional regulator, partial [Acinetobacter sp.]
IELSTKLSFEDYLQQIIHFQLEQIQTRQFLWAQTFLLERQVSNIQSYRKSYAMMVQMWHSILEPYIDDAEQLKRMSLNMQRVCYGFVSQALLVEHEFEEWYQLEKDIHQSLVKLNF